MAVKPRKVIALPDHYAVSLHAAEIKGARFKAEQKGFQHDGLPSEEDWTGSSKSESQIERGLILELVGSA